MKRPVFQSNERSLKRRFFQSNARPFNSKRHAPRRRHYDRDIPWHPGVQQQKQFPDGGMPA
jgi:hypothetical protein